MPLIFVNSHVIITKGSLPTSESHFKLFLAVVRKNSLKFFSRVSSHVTPDHFTACFFMVYTQSPVPPRVQPDPILAYNTRWKFYVRGLFLESWKKLEGGDAIATSYKAPWFFLLHEVMTFAISFVYSCPGVWIIIYLVWASVRICFLCLYAILILQESRCRCKGREQYLHKNDMQTLVSCIFMNARAMWTLMFLKIRFYESIYEYELKLE